MLRGKFIGQRKEKDVIDTGVLRMNTCSMQKDVILIAPDHFG